MKVKSRNIIELVIQALLALLMVLPGFIQVSQWAQKSTFGGYSLVYRSSKSFLDFTTSNGDVAEMLGFAFLATLIAGIVLAIIQVVSKGKKANSKILLFVAIAQIVLFVAYLVNAVTYTNTIVNSRFDTDPDFLLFICAAVLLASTVFIIIGYRMANSRGVIDSAPVSSSSGEAGKSSVAELEELKKLLDQGILTQEEFDAKKKQLLGI